MGTKNNPGAYDCYVNAAPDEPMFILLGRDPCAPMLVALWATIRQQMGEDQGKINEARQCMTAMAEWAHLHAKPEKLAKFAEALKELGTAVREAVG
jgi:hypothetical protein